VGDCIVSRKGIVPATSFCFVENKMMGLPSAAFLTFSARGRSWLRGDPQHHTRHRRYEPKSSSMVKMIEALECVSCFCISSAV